MPTTSPGPTVDELRSLFLFESLDDATLQWLAAHAEVRVYGAGTVVFGEDEPAEALFVLMDGGLAMTKHAGGEEVLINETTHRGAYAGATRAFATGAPQAYQTSLRATRPSRFLRLPAEDFATLVHRQCPMAVHLLDGTVVRDERGFVPTGPALLVDGRRPPAWPLDRDPWFLESSVPGVFVAGDARAESVKRVASAVGEGAMAVTLVHRYLGER